MRNKRPESPEGRGGPQPFPDPRRGCVPGDGADVGMSFVRVGWGTRGLRPGGAPFRRRQGLLGPSRPARFPAMRGLPQPAAALRPEADPGRRAPRLLGAGRRFVAGARAHAVSGPDPRRQERRGVRRPRLGLRRRARRTPTGGPEHRGPVHGLRNSEVQKLGKKHGAPLGGAPHF